MIKKKITALSLTALLVFALCGCKTTESFRLKNETLETENQTIVSNNGNGGLSQSVKMDTYNNEDPADFDIYQKYYFEFLGEDVMPITNWISPPSSMYNEKTIADFAECGLNVFMQYGSGSDKTLLDLCEKYGIGALLWSIDSSKQYFTHPAFFGAILGDEPGMMDFAEHKDTYLEWEEMANNRMLFVNLLGPTVDSRTAYYAASAMNTETDWNAVKDEPFSFDSSMTPSQITNEYYYRKAVEMFSPKFLSSDFYTGVGAFPRVSTGYYKNLQFMTKLAIDLNVPLFNYIQACGFSVYWNYSYRVPRREDILWNVNASLAFGTKGFEYFCYYDPNSSSYQKFIGSPIAQDGTKTETYYSVQAANRYIAAVDEWLINSKWQGIMHAGTSLCEIPEGLLSAHGELSNVNGEHVLVGCFDYLKGKECYYVINDSLTESTSVTLSFKTAQNLKTVDDAQSMDMQDITELSFNLAPATAKLIVIQ